MISEAVGVIDVSFRNKLVVHKQAILILAGLLFIAVVGLFAAVVVIVGRDSCDFPPSVRVEAIISAATAGPACPTHSKLAQLTIPSGFMAFVYACNLIGPRQLTPVALDGVGTVTFVGSRKYRTNSSVYALVDPSSNGTTTHMVILDSGLDQPNGVEWLDGALYVATARALLRYDGVDLMLQGKSTHTLRTTLHAAAFPALSSLQWHYLRKRGRILYASNSAGCDHCLPKSPEAAAIVSLRPDTCFTPRVELAGIRFSVGFAFSSATDEIIFTNNAHDSIEGDDPWDSIHRMVLPPTPPNGANVPHFGFPYCYTSKSSASRATSNEALVSHAYDVAGSLQSCSQYEAGTAIGSHTAPLGVTIQDQTTGTLLIAERGAFGGTAGHYVSTVARDLSEHRPVITGFIDESSGQSWGRPVDVQMMPGGDGSYLVSDDKGNAVYRFAPV